MEENSGDRDKAKPIGLDEIINHKNKNVTKTFINRQMGVHRGPAPFEFQTLAEEKLIKKEMLEEMQCSIPESARSTFLMVFSPDGKKIASTHGNHNVYVTDVATGKNIQTLSGHPRTPWCIAFHPSSNQILASGCLAGQVRVWDLSGGSEMWMTDSQSVIASLAFHPIDRMLVVATCNKLYFWDWSQPEPFAKCSTVSEREKVRYVTFDRLGNKLITGIANHIVQSQWDRLCPHVPATTTTNTTSVTTTTGTVMAATLSTGTTSTTSAARPSERERSIASCYRNLMNQYNQLVRRYFDLSHRSRATPTTDRGTDPMETINESQPSTSGTQTNLSASRAAAIPSIDADAESTSSGSGSEVSLIVNPGSVNDTNQTNRVNRASRHRPAEFPNIRIRSLRAMHASNSAEAETNTRGDHLNERSSETLTDAIPASEAPSASFVRPMRCTCLSANGMEIQNSNVVNIEDTPTSSSSMQPDHSSNVEPAVLPTTVPETEEGESQNRRTSESQSDEYEFSQWLKNIPARSSRGKTGETSTASLPAQTSANLATSGVSETQSQSRELLVLSEGDDSSTELVTTTDRPVVVETDSEMHPRLDTVLDEMNRGDEDWIEQDSVDDPLNFITQEQFRELPGDDSSTVLTSTDHPERVSDPDPGLELTDSPRAVVARTDDTSQHPRPVPAFQVVDRVFNRFSANQDNLGSSSSSHRFQARPHGQFVLSRHSNSPFQPRVPLRIEAPPVTQPPATPPTIPSQASSFRQTRKNRFATLFVNMAARSRRYWTSSPTVRIDIPTTSSADNLPESTSRPNADTSGVNNDVAPNNEGPQPAGAARERVRAYLDRIRTTPPDSTMTDSTTNYSRLVRETDADTGPDFSWDADSETLIIRPRDNASSATGDSTATPLSTAGASTDRPPTRPLSLAAQFDNVNRHIENLQRLVRARVELIHMREVRSAVQSLRNRLNSIPSRGTDESFETNLHGQVRRLRALVYELRAGIDNVVRSRDVSTMLESASLNDAPATSVNESPTLMPLADSSNLLHELASAMALDLMNCPENCQPQPGPSSASDLPPRNDPAMLSQLTSIVLGIVNRRLDMDNATNPPDPQPGPSQLPQTRTASTQPPTPIPSSSLPSNNLTGHSARCKRAHRSTSSSEAHREHNYHASEIRRRMNLPRRIIGRHPTRLRRSVRNSMYLRSYLAMQHPMDVNWLPSRGNAGRASSTQSGSSQHPTPAPAPAPAPNNSQAGGSTPAATSTCQVCGVRKSSSAGKRKATNPQRFRPPKQPRTSRHSPYYPSRVFINMMERMQNMVRMQRANRNGQGILAMTGEERSIVNEIEEEVRRIGLPIRVRSTPQLLRTFRRNLAQLRAHQLLDSMVHSVSAFFEGTDYDLVDNQIMRLYRLHQLALELTDLLFDQIRTSSADELGAEESTQEVTSRATDVTNPSSLSQLFSSPPPNISITRSSTVTTHTASTASSTPPAVTVSSPLSTSGVRPCHVTVTRLREPVRSRPYISMVMTSLRDRELYYSSRLARQLALERNHPPTGPSQPPPLSVPRETRTAPSNRLYRRTRFFSHRSSSTLRNDMTRLPLSRYTGPVFRRGNQTTPHPETNTESPPAQSPASADPAIPRLFSRSWRSMFATNDSSDQVPAWNRTSGPTATHAEIVVPVVRVNDVPVSDTNSLNMPRSSTFILPSPLVEDQSRWRYYRPRLLHPRYLGPNPFEDQDNNLPDPPPNFLRYFNPTTGLYIDPIMIAESSISAHHRIQAWDFSHHVIPKISDRDVNGVVAECKIHNDASVDVSADGTFLVTLLPSGRLSVTTMLGVYSLNWKTLGQLLYKTGFEQNAVSVSISPTARHIIVGLASRPLGIRERERTNMAQIFRLGGSLPVDNCTWYTPRGVLKLARDLEQSREMSAMSLNCIRWAPGPGCGLVYGTNTGQLVILR